MPIIGHINPGLPIAKELVRRGHDVRWYSTEAFRSSIEKTGARFVPIVGGIDLDKIDIDNDPHWSKRNKLKGIKQLQWDMKHLFIDGAAGYLAEISAEYDREPFDVIVGDNTAGVCGLMHERFGVPWCVYGISVFTLASKDTPPFGIGVLPKSGLGGRVRDRMLYWVVDNIVFKPVSEYYKQTRVKLGFAEPTQPFLDFVRDADLYLQSSVPQFEYPRTDLPEMVKFIGAFTPEAPSNWTPPSWWHELDGNRPVVLLTQGTVANNYDELIRPAIRALASEDIKVIVTTGSKPAEEVGIDPLPANVRVEQFIPYAHLMPKVDLLLTNGGYGSVQMALSNGVPVIAAGASEEKPEVANRVTWSGVGMGLKTKSPTEEQILALVRKVLHDPSYRNKAREIQRELAKLDAPRLAADWLEKLVPARERVRVSA